MIRRLLALRLCLGILGIIALISVAEPHVSYSQKAAFRASVILRGLENPFGFAFLPDGGILVTERPGRLRLIRNGVLSGGPIGGLPPIAEGGQGGLLDIVLHPDFVANQLLYLSHTCAGEDGAAATCVSRGRFTGRKLEQVEMILEAGPPVRGGAHFGSRLTFGADGKLYVTLGERYRREAAQDLGQLRGKVLRLNDNGSIPLDNPFIGREDARPEIYSYGHCNPLGLAFQPGTRSLWEVELGPAGGDELNLIMPGRNYGWPVVSHGRDFNGAPIGEGKSKPGLEDPVRAWVPALSPAGMAFYDGNAFPGWRGNLFVAGLAAEVLTRLELEGTRVVAEEALLQGQVGPIRDVRQGPDGKLWLLIDATDGALLRLDPM